MSSSDEGFWGLVALVAGGILAVQACTPQEESKDYKAGYEVGYYDGRDEGLEAGREEICDRIGYRLNSGARDAVCD